MKKKGNILVDNTIAKKKKYKQQTLHPFDRNKSVCSVIRKLNRIL